MNVVLTSVVIATVFIIWGAYEYGRIRGRTDLWKKLEPDVEKVIASTNKAAEVNKGIVEQYEKHVDETEQFRKIQKE